MLDVRRGRTPLERSYHYRCGKRLKPVTAKDKKRCEWTKPTKKDSKWLSSETVAAGCQQPQKVASSTTCATPTPHTANVFATLEVEEATAIQPERWLEKLAKPMAHTNKTSGRKSRSVKKKAPTNASTRTEELFER